MIYIIIHSMINTKGINDEANARVIGSYSHRDLAIKEAEKWIRDTKTSDVSIKRITDTEWYFCYGEKGKTYGGYVEVVISDLDAQAV